MIDAWANTPKGHFTHKPRDLTMKLSKRLVTIALQGLSLVE